MITDTKATKDPSQTDASEIPLSALLERARALQTQLADAKPLYSELDAIVLEVARRRAYSAGTVETLPDGTSVVLVDSFVDKDGHPKLTAWKSCGIARFTLDFTDPLTAKRGRKERS